MAGSVSKTSHRAIVYITKIEAARRQVDAAIRMSFFNEDDLAIHTVASAGYRILRDLLNKRGRDDTEQLLKAGIFSCAQSLVHGKMSVDERDKLNAQTTLWPLIIAVAE